MKTRRIQPKPIVELETVSLRLPSTLLRAVDQYARYLGGGSDRTYVVTQALKLTLEHDAQFQKHLEGLARPMHAPAAEADEL